MFWGDCRINWIGLSGKHCRPHVTTQSCDTVLCSLSSLSDSISGVSLCSRKTLHFGKARSSSTISSYLRGCMALDVPASKRALPLSANIVPDQNGDNITTKLEGDEDRKKEHKKRSKNWTRLETLRLIGARREFDNRFRKSGKRVELWEEIAHVLQAPDFSRDGQQCKDKWEKLTAGYKEVMDGARKKEDYPYYEELHDLLLWKPQTSFCRGLEYPRDGLEPAFHSVEALNNRDVHIESEESPKNGSSSLNKRKRSEEGVSSVDLTAVQKLLETIIARQQVFFKDMLDAIERKDVMREQMRHEKEEKWRSEERAQRLVFHNAMIVLIRGLLGEKSPVGTGMPMASRQQHTVTTPQSSDTDRAQPKKRSKNWKRSEVMHLIRFRRDMQDKFMNSTRRAGLWDEMSEKLAGVGINRDGKQCREKWDKLVAEYKEVMDGRKEREESSYFAELTTLLGKAKRAEIKDLEEHEGLLET